MNPLMSNIAATLCKAVREHAKGTDVSDAEIVQAMRDSIPGTIKAACDACARGEWVTKVMVVPPSAHAAPAAVVPDKKAPKKK